MPKAPAGRPAGTSTFDVACDVVSAAVSGGFRRALVSELAGARTMGHGLRRLRDMMRAHAFRASGERIELSGVIPELDRRTRDEGFHALHDWDGRAERFNADTIPVEVLTFLIERRGGQPADPVVPAVLVDYYFVYVLGLLALRAWDGEDVNSNLDRVTALLVEVQGQGGSGQKFAADAETLVLLATSHYEPDEDGYDALLGRLSVLADTHQARMGLVHAQCMGGHLRFGFEATYARNEQLMRDDNVADYPWLLWAAAAVMRELDRMIEAGVEGPSRETYTEALLNALCTDPEAILREPPPSFAPLEAARQDFLERFGRRREVLLPAFDRLKPTDRDYSPLSFFFNFSQNVLKGAVADALLWGEPWDLSLNDLFTGLPPSSPRNIARVRLASTLMNYARNHPDTIRGRLTPVIVYDPAAGRRNWRRAMEVLSRDE